jgi:Acetyltransferase (GNAT) family.
MSDQVSIRRGDPTDRLAVVRLFDAAMLDTAANRLRRQLTATDGLVLIATHEETPVGAIALDASAASDEEQVDIDSTRVDGDTDPVRITAIAVRRRRRDREIGRALIETAAERVAPRPLTAGFDEGVRPFYDACGFEIDPHNDRYWGIRWPETASTETPQ